MRYAIASLGGGSRTAQAEAARRAIKNAGLACREVVNATWLMNAGDRS